MLSGAPITPDEDKRLRHIARSTFARDTPQERLAYSIDSTEDASSSYDGASLYASKSASSASSLPLYPFVVAIITVFVIRSGLFTDSFFSSEITAAGRTFGTHGIKIVGFCEENSYLRERSRRLAPDALVFTDLATLPRDLEASDLGLGDVDVVSTSTRCRARSIAANTDPLWRAPDDPFHVALDVVRVLSPRLPVFELAPDQSKTHLDGMIDLETLESLRFDMSYAMDSNKIDSSSLGNSISRTSRFAIGRKPSANKTDLTPKRYLQPTLPVMKPTSTPGPDPRRPLAHGRYPPLRRPHRVQRFSSCGQRWGLPRSSRLRCPVADHSAGTAFRRRHYS